MSKLPRGITVEQLKQRVLQNERDAAIGRMVRLKLTSRNSVPCERAVILAKEVAAIDEKSDD